MLTHASLGCLKQGPGSESLYWLGIHPLTHFSGLLWDNQVFFIGTKWKDRCNRVEHTHTHANTPRQAVMRVFLRESRTKSLYFIKLLVSAQSLQKSCLDHRKGRAEVYGKNILANLEHESPRMSRVISTVINYGNHGKCKTGLKKSKSVHNFWFELWNLRFSLAPLPDTNRFSR